MKHVPHLEKLQTPHYIAGLLAISLCLLANLAAKRPAQSVREAMPDEPHRSPIALALHGPRLLTANHTANGVSFIDLQTGKILQELSTGDRPAGVAFSPDGKRAVVTHQFGYDLAVLDVEADSLKLAGRVEVGPEPRGVVIAPDETTAYVAVGVTNEVVRVDLKTNQVTGRLEVGREPRGLALSHDGKTLVAGNARSGSLSIIDTANWRVTRTARVDGTNLRQVVIDDAGKYAYVANMKNLRFATTKNNIDQGWVLGQRVARVRLDEQQPFETLSIDPRGKAASDAHGLVLSDDAATLVVSLGGTHELMIFRAGEKPLPWRDNGSRDLIAPELLRDQERFRRVSLGGRPTELALSADGSLVYVANYLLDAVQVVDTRSARLVRTIELGGPNELSLARRGEVLFHDAARSFNQWYSCNTCHSDGHTNGQDFDTLNDGWQDLSTLHERSRKKVPTLRRVAETGPWTWHGWQDSLDEAMVESFTKSMQGPQPSKEEVAALIAYLKTLDYPANPFRGRDGSISEAAKRGEVVYRSEKAGCVTCHGGSELTDGKIHDLDLGERGDVYKGHNPPSLRGVYDKDPYMHDGRAKDLREVLTKWHNPEEVTGLGSLDEAELADLLEYLKTL